MPELLLVLQAYCASHMSRSVTLSYGRSSLPFSHELCERISDSLNRHPSNRSSGQEHAGVPTISAYEEAYRSSPVQGI